MCHGRRILQCLDSPRIHYERSCSRLWRSVVSDEEMLTAFTSLTETAKGLQGRITCVESGDEEASARQLGKCMVDECAERREVIWVGGGAREVGDRDHVAFARERYP